MNNLNSGYYRVATPIVYKGFNLGRGFFAFKVEGKLYFSSGWTCNNCMMAYTLVEGNYIGQWLRGEDSIMVQAIIDSQIE